MWELERESDLPDLTRLRCAIVGASRLGRALAPALLDAGIDTSGPLGRGADGGDADVVILRVPDGEIAEAAAAIAPRPGRFVGHCSRATTLAPLAPHTGFSLHPLMSVPLDGASRLAGAASAITDKTLAAHALATAIAFRLGLTPVAIADLPRAAYHAAASIASNFLVRIEAAAERIGASAGLGRDALVPLVRATLENWAALGAERAVDRAARARRRGDRRATARRDRRAHARAAGAVRHACRCDPRAGSRTNPRLARRSPMSMSNT